MNNKLRKYEGGPGYYPSLIHRFFEDDFFSKFTESTLPAVNVKEKKREYILEISAPGFEKENVSIQVDRNVMTITAKTESQNEEKGDDEKVLRREFTSASFSRSFTLPDNVEPDKIEAKEKNGILTIKIPKNDNEVQETTRHIEIK